MREPPPENNTAHLLISVHEKLSRLERLIEPEVAAGRAVGREVVPAWRRATRGEHRLPVSAAVAAAIGLQVALPGHLSIHPSWLLPALEGLLLVGQVVANPARIDRTSTFLRAASVVLIVLISVANAWSSAALISGLVRGTNSDNAALLLGSGANIYLTNILLFALWYWEWDGGGPVGRARGVRRHPDFMFPQMANPDLAPPHWKPTFVDYLYLSFTNATAFSPTDTMPLVPWAKLLMLVQSGVALLTVGLVIARAVNVLK
jgi:hypothetical protein